MPISVSASLLFVLACVPRSAAQEEIDLDRYAASGAARRVPIVVSGFTGETARVLRFDLEVAGLEIASADKAQYALEGSNNGQLEARLSDAINKSVKFAKVYSGGGARAQIHTLADEAVQAITGKAGIARTKIAFRTQKGQDSELWIADYDGYNAVAVTRDNTVVAAPCWVPGHRKLYYTTYKFGNPDIIWHDLNSGTRELFARYSGLNTSPAVSPDGRKVAMILSKSGSPDVYVANADGSGLLQLTKTKEDESSPCWSPDGKSVAFATRMSGRRVLARVPAGGGSTERIRIAGVSNPSEPDWSPDGKWIAFTAQMGGFEICVVPASGGEASVLVSGEDPSWAPNSRTLVFTKRLGDGKRALSLLDVLTKQVKDVAQSLGSSSQPAWSR